jgi:uncharacterized protein with GYD domain
MERGATMPKYLVQGSYTRAGIEGLVEDGGTGRRRAVEGLANGVGGTVEAFYFSFGGDDVVAILELPDDETAAALALTSGRIGAIKLRTTVLLTPEQLDAAIEKKVDYTPPSD